MAAAFNVGIVLPLTLWRDSNPRYSAVMPTCHTSNVSTGNVIECDDLDSMFFIGIQSSTDDTFTRSNNTVQLVYILIRCDHRNLRTRTSMFAQVLQIYFGKELLAKNQLISTLDKVIYFKGTIFQGCTKPLFTSQNRVEISWKNVSFFKHASSRVALGFLWV
jgi:hypothetical protein